MDTKKMTVEQELKRAREMNMIHVSNAAEDAGYIALLKETCDVLYEQYEHMANAIITTADKMGNVELSEAVRFVKVELEITQIGMRAVSNSYDSWKKERGYK